MKGAERKKARGKEKELVKRKDKIIKCGDLAEGKKGRRGKEKEGMGICLKGRMGRKEEGEEGDCPEEKQGIRKEGRWWRYGVC